MATEPGDGRAQTQVLTGPLEQLRGVIGREPDPDECYRFEFGAVATRRVHMVGVREPLRVEWWADGELVAGDRLEPWTGTAAHRADTVLEMGVRR